MVALSSNYSRHAFETADDVEAVCEELAKELSLRMRRSRSATADVEVLVDELRSLGHQLCEWDSNGGEWEIWGGDYANPEENRIIVSFHYGGDAPPWADVSFGPWPSPEPKSVCLQCSQGMTATTLRLQGEGHGRADVPSIRLTLSLGEAEPVVASCGVRSVDVQVPALWCSGCNALWIRDVRAIQR